jgi:phage terminase large subunit GpA-like protein
MTTQASTSARRSQVAIPHARGHLLRYFGHRVRPRPVQTVSEWSEKYRILTTKSASEPGRWRTDRTPYLREILDTLSETSPVQRIVLRFGSQLGKTEVGLNWIGYVMHHAPGPMLVVLPTLEVRKVWVRQRLDPLLTATPALAAIFDARSKRDAGNAEDLKDFPGGMLRIGGANSPASLASMPIRYVLCDEVDRFPWEAGAEGDPLGLIDQRTSNFPRRKVLLISTPTVAGLSRIDDEYEASDRRQYQVPCPHCGERQVLDWHTADGGLSLQRSESTGAVWYPCRHCGARIDEHHKPDMLARGIWAPRSPGRAVRGYALNGLYSPIGLGFSWSELLDQWDASKGDTSRLKRFVNTIVGEVWEEQGDSLDPLHLMGRLEDYADQLEGVVRTVGVDVQADRIELTVVDWDENEEAWVQDHLILPGDTALPEVWAALGAELAELRPQAIAIDTGYRTTHVHSFAKGKAWVYPVKGMPGPGRPVTEDERKRRMRMRQRRKRSAEIFLVGVDQAKAVIYARAKLADAGPGFLHFPNRPAFDDEYFAQLAAEKLITKVRGTRAFAEWVQTRARNEALDCMVYALAAYRLLGESPRPPRRKEPDTEGAAQEKAQAKKAQPAPRKALIR